MARALCYAGAAVALILLLVFGMDLGLGFPFKTVSKTMDIGVIICSAILGYLSWDTWREQT